MHAGFACVFIKTGEILELYLMKERGDDYEFIRAKFTGLLFRSCSSST